MLFKNRSPIHNPTPKALHVKVEGRVRQAWEMNRRADNREKQITELSRQGLSYTQVALAMGLNRESIKSYCRRNKLGGIGADIVREQDGISKNCGTEIKQYPRVKKRKFCCEACRRSWRNSHPYAVNRKALYETVCQNCGVTFLSYGNNHRKYCCHACYIEARFGKKTE